MGIRATVRRVKMKLSARGKDGKKTKKKHPIFMPCVADSDAN